MRHNPKAVQQWAATVTRHEFWDDVKVIVRARLTEDLLSAVEDSDIEQVRFQATRLLVLDDVFQTLSAIGVDTDFKREYHEVLEDDAF